ncbi:AhpD family alkylhydroperoxidase [Bradyrhizobium sp. JR6.1]
MSMRIDYNKVAPAGIKALGGVYGYLTQCGLPAALIELVYLRISQINGCAYCLDMHTRSLQKMGVAVEKLALLQVWREAEVLFDAEERAALGPGPKPSPAWRRQRSRTKIIGLLGPPSARSSWST